MRAANPDRSLATEDTRNTATSTQPQVPHPTPLRGATFSRKREKEGRRHALVTSVGCRAPDLLAVTFRSDLYSTGWAYCRSGMT
jgi:hypothetical protein